MIYEYAPDRIISDLKSCGFAKLPSVKPLVEKDDYLKIYKNENGSKTYKQNSLSHLQLMKDMNLNNLFDELYMHAREINRFADPNDRYFVTRYIKNGQTSEGYRGHFDSHLFTIVIPVVIPTNGKTFFSGELFAIPNFREHVTNEFTNVCQKIFYKKFNNRTSYLEMIESKKATVLDFEDFEPFIFYGTRTFHGNFPLVKSNSDRLTFLCHLYDTTPNWGVGSLLRRIRNR